MLEPFFIWCESTFIGTAIQESLWAFAVVESLHLIGLCVLGSALLVVDLRLLGAGMTGRPIAELARQARPWFFLGVVVLVSTGIPLFLSEAIKAYYNRSFWVKLTLPVALLFTTLVRDRVALDEALETSARSRLVGFLSLVLWVTVAAAGRWIGYS